MGDERVIKKEIGKLFANKYGVKYFETANKMTIGLNECQIADSTLAPACLC